MNLMSGRIGVADLAANAISMNYDGFIFMTCVGIGVSTGTLVGNSIGEGNIINAKRYIYVGCVMSTFIILFLDTFIIGFKYQLARLLTRDAEVVELLENLIYMIALCVLFDANQGTLGKILIAMGRQANASWINLFSYYALMVPIGAVTGFWLGWRVYGIWVGVTVATLSVCIGYSYTVYTTDWIEVEKKIVKKKKEFV
eukprot:TRINITY_DN7035_c0_g2_i9.p1 TRINITY_DN7035_c0_g2~~TRINITY_DN7035_c0_g2_i9.p1  ORF type:complete len:199 (-),score=31.14 TRINITY_DN7035_c0_g2_i9:75-671(-)